MTSILTLTVLRSRVSMTGGQILITTTPYNLGWLYQNFFIPWKMAKTSHYHYSLLGNLLKTRISIKNFTKRKKKIKTRRLSRRYEGEFKKMTGLVYDIPQEQIIAPIDVNIKTEARIIGVDWGFKSSRDNSFIFKR